MLSQNKTVNYVVGGLAIASLALLAYTVTRPTRTGKKSKSGKRKRKASSNKKKSKKYVKKFTKKPIDVSLVMQSMDGFNAHVAGDKRNDKLDLKYGSRLIKINDKRVDNLSYQEIFDILQKTKTPITLQFRQDDKLCEEWTKAEQLKASANSDFKEKKIDSAIRKVTAAIQLHPTNKIYYSNRILMLLQINKYEEALQDCQIIRELDPKSVYIKGHYLRGLTLLKLKKFKNAASAFQTVVKLNPDFKKAKDRLNECLKELQQDTNDEEKRISSKQQELKETFQQKEDGNEEEEEQKDKETDAKQEQSIETEDVVNVISQEDAQTIEVVDKEQVKDKEEVTDPVKEEKVVVKEKEEVPVVKDKEESMTAVDKVAEPVDKVAEPVGNVAEPVDKD